MFTTVLEGMINLHLHKNCNQRAYPPHFFLFICSCLFLPFMRRGNWVFLRFLLHNQICVFLRFLFFVFAVFEAIFHVRACFPCQQFFANFDNTFSWCLIVYICYRPRPAFFCEIFLAENAEGTKFVRKMRLRKSNFFKVLCSFSRNRFFYFFVFIAWFLLRQYKSVQTLQHIIPQIFTLQVIRCPARKWCVCGSTLLQVFMRLKAHWHLPPSYLRPSCICQGIQWFTQKSKTT